MEHLVLDIVDMLYNMIAEAWGVPLGNEKCIIERDKALALLDDMKAQLPLELHEARRLVNARNEFVESAKREAEAIRANAEEEARKMVEQQYVMQLARKEAEDICLTAETKAREVRRVTSEFLDDALRQTEDAVAAVLDNIRVSRAQFRSVVTPAPEARVEVTMEDVEDVDIMAE
jgi:predicted transcriptional regulator